MKQYDIVIFDDKFNNIFNHNQQYNINDEFHNNIDDYFIEYYDFHKYDNIDNYYDSRRCRQQRRNAAGLYMVVRSER